MTTLYGIALKMRDYELQGGSVEHLVALLEPNHPFEDLNPSLVCAAAECFGDCAEVREAVFNYWSEAAQQGRGSLDHDPAWPAVAAIMRGDGDGR